MADLPSLADLAGRVRPAADPPHALTLAFDGLRVGVRTNAGELADRLGAYFAPFVERDGAGPDLTITALEGDEPDFGVPLAVWPREPGKTQRKEEIADLDGGRVIRKVRTGMQFLVGPGVQLAVGPCLRNANQVINFLIFQYIGWWMHRGWLLCHAAGVVREGRGVAIAARSGGGKSTLALTLMNHGVALAGNDRLLIKAEGHDVFMRGVPKLPRINPGTALNNPRLSGLVPDAKRAQYERLSRGELWAVEDKYDVPIDRVVDGGRFELHARLSGLVVLDWRHDADTPTSWEMTEAGRHPEVLPDVMKAPGPFFRLSDGTPSQPTVLPDPGPYLETLAGVPLVIGTGRADFASGVDAVNRLWT